MLLSRRARPLTFLSLLLFARSARAHGWVAYITADGKNYTGPGPVDQDGTLSSKSPIRQIASEGPIMNVSSVDIACGADGNAPASQVVTVTAGSVLDVEWYSGDDSPRWPHDNGPILTYLAPCSSSSCQDDPTKLKWFKIQQDGQVPGNATEWVQAELTSGAPYQVVIPSGVPTGYYIMRNEIISLQNAVAGLAESYPSCFQLSITSSSSTSQSTFMNALPPNATIFLPGGYNKSDPGWNVDVYTNPEKLNYNTMFPGPTIPDELSNVQTGGGGGGGGSNGTTTSSSAPSSSTPPPSPSASSTSVVQNKKITSAPPASGSGSPNAFTTTITKVLVMTMTLPDTIPTISSSPSYNNTDGQNLVRVPIPGKPNIQLLSSSSVLSSSTPTASTSMTPVRTTPRYSSQVPSTETTSGVASMRRRGPRRTRSNDRHHHH